MLSVVGQRKSGRAQAGFTLIELMVVLGIIVIISTVILVSSSRFNSAILLRSLAYQVGLSIRQAQLYGVAVVEGPVETQCARGGESKFCSAFGVHFDKNFLARYHLFADVNNDGIDNDGYDPVERFNAQYGFTISNFCVLGTSVKCSAKSCPVQYSGCTPSAISTMDIAFRRPNPEARITADSDPNSQYNSAFIVVEAPGGATRSVSVSLTGQIVVTGGAN